MRPPANLFAQTNYWHDLHDAIVRRQIAWLLYSAWSSGSTDIFIFISMSLIGIWSMNPYKCGLFPF